MKDRLETKCSYDIDIIFQNMDSVSLRYVSIFTSHC